MTTDVHPDVIVGPRADDDAERLGAAYAALLNAECERIEVPGMEGAETLQAVAQWRRAKGV